MEGKDLPLCICRDLEGACHAFKNGHGLRGAVAFAHDLLTRPDHLLLNRKDQDSFALFVGEVDDGFDLADERIGLRGKELGSDGSPLSDARAPISQASRAQQECG